MKKTKSDHAFSLMKAAVEAVPFIGGSLASLLEDYIPTSVDKRKTQLLKQLNKDFETLQEHYNENALTKDNFITTFMEAFSQAIRTHHEEKITAFRAIILNTLITHTAEEDEIEVFIGMTQRLTPLHIKLLKILANPSEAVEKNSEAKAKIESVSMGGLSTLTSALLTEYSPEFVGVAFNDLYSMGLHNTSSFNVTMTKHGILQKRTTEFGDKYIQFISLPPDVERNQKKEKVD